MLPWVLGGAEFAVYVRPPGPGAVGRAGLFLIGFGDVKMAPPGKGKI